MGFRALVTTTNIEFEKFLCVILVKSIQCPRDSRTALVEPAIFRLPPGFRNGFKYHSAMFKRSDCI